MHGRSVHFVLALLVTVLTVLAPDGSLLSPVDSGPAGAPADPATATPSDAVYVAPVAPADKELESAGQMTGSSGMVTVTVRVLDAKPKPPQPPAAVPSLPVWRFYNRMTDTHFYTFSEEERLHVIATWPSIFRFEGYAYGSNPITDTVPLYRFFNQRTGTHFYTASEDEKATVIRNWPTIFRYEGPAYGVSLAYSPGKRTVYRFFNMRTGAHFYTASEEEKNHVIATFPTYRFEGIAFFVGP